MPLMTRVVSLMVLSALLTACGWQLRGGGQGSLAGRALAIEPRVGEGELLRATRRSLRRLEADLVEPGTGGAAVLELLGENTGRRTIATDDNGRPSAYELEYRVRFAVRDAEGETALAPRQVRAQDSYQASPLNAQAEQSQRQRLTEELRDQVVQLMLSQVAGALDEPESAQ